MKTSTIFLVALTVFTSLFLEASAAPAEIDWQSLTDVVKDIGTATGDLVDDAKASVSGVVENVKDAFDDTVKSLQDKIDSVRENSVKVDKKLKKFVFESIEEAYAALTDLLETNEDDLAKASGVEKEVLDKVLKRLKNFNNIIRVIYTALKGAIRNGNSTLIKIVVTILSAANEKTKKDQAEIIQTLNETPGEIVNSFKAVVKKDVDFMVAIAEEIVTKLDTVSSTDHKASV